MGLYLNTEKTIGFPIVPPTWDDFRVPLNAIKVGPAGIPEFAQFKDNGAASTGVFAYWFDKALEEQVYFAVQIPHEWKQGGMISPHVHWTPKTNGALNAKVSWGLEYTWQEIGGVYGNTNIISTNTHMPEDATLLAGKHYLSPFPDIDGSAIDSVSSMLICRLFRDATGALKTDDYDDDAGLLEFDIHILRDSTGSRTEYAK